MKKEIQLHSRGNIDNRLIKIGDKTYKLSSPYNYRVGFKDSPNDEEYTFIDPAGGPFITPGYEIEEGYVVKSIKNRGIIEFE